MAEALERLCELICSFLADKLRMNTYQGGPALPGLYEFLGPKSYVCLEDQRNLHDGLSNTPYDPGSCLQQGYNQCTSLSYLFLLVPLLNYVLF